jgi:type II secretory pathway predicted ATPase ExeA
LRPGVFFCPRPAENPGDDDRCALTTQAAHPRVTDVIPANAFAPGCTPQSFLETVAAAEVLRRLDDGLGEREPFLLLSGETGTGKTTLAKEAVARWGGRVSAAFVAYPALSGVELLEEVLRRFGAEPPEGASRSRFMAAIEHVLADVVARGQMPMIVVDDAHALTGGLLEELRLLVNAARQAGQPLEVLLVGLPALAAALEEPALSSLRQRVSVHARLDAFSPGETRRYVRHRASVAGGDGSALFSRTTCMHLATLSRGVPRQLNALAGEALRLAIASHDSTVRPEHVQAAAVLLRGPGPVVVAVEDMADMDDETGEVATEAMSEAAAPPALVGPQAARVEPAKPAEPAKSAAPAPTPVPAPANVPASEPAPAPAAPPASQDPREWVRRFVGDAGPVQIGSRAMAGPGWAMERTERVERFEPARMSAAAGAAGKPKPRRIGVAMAPPTRPSHGSGGRALTTALLVAALLVAAIVLGWRAGLLAHGPWAHARTATTAITTPTQAPPVIAKASVAAPAPRVVPPTHAPEPASAAQAPPLRGPFTLEVGSSPDLQEAYAQRDIVQGLTGFKGWVVPAPEGSGQPHRVIVGIYRQRSRADAAANMLLRSKTLSEVTVVSLPPRARRN